jgi:hypothetical protein
MQQRVEGSSYSVIREGAFTVLLSAICVLGPVVPSILIAWFAVGSVRFAGYIGASLLFGVEEAWALFGTLPIWIHATTRCAIAVWGVSALMLLCLASIALIYDDAEQQRR